jgi:hypothetical protein
MPGSVERWEATKEELDEGQQGTEFSEPQTVIPGGKAEVPDDKHFVAEVARARGRVERNIAETQAASAAHEQSLRGVELASARAQLENGPDVSEIHPINMSMPKPEHEEYPSGKMRTRTWSDSESEGLFDKIRKLISRGEK